MPPFPPDRRRCRILPALAAMAVLGAPAMPASSAAPAGDILVRGQNPSGVIGDGTFRLEQMVITQGPENRISADLARVRDLEGASYHNSTWDLDGTVKVKYDGVAMDATHATVVFRNGQVQSILVESQPPGAQPRPEGKVHVEYENVVMDASRAAVRLSGGRAQSIRVEGRPATFSHQQARSAARHQGRANTIVFNPGTGRLLLDGDNWYSNGRGIETSLDNAIEYNVRTGVIQNSNPDEPTRFEMLIRDDARVPAPRTPDRSTAP